MITNFDFQKTAAQTENTGKKSIKSNIRPNND